MKQDAFITAMTFRKVGHKRVTKKCVSAKVQLQIPPEFRPEGGGTRLADFERLGF